MSNIHIHTVKLQIIHAVSFWRNSEWYNLPYEEWDTTLCLLLCQCVELIKCTVWICGLKCSYLLSLEWSVDLTFVYTCKYEYMYTIIDFCIKSTHPSTYIHVFTGIHRFLSNKIFQFHRLNVNYRKGRSSTYYFLGKGREINMCRSKVNSLTIRNWCCSLSNSMMRWAADVFLFFRLINWEGL